MCEKHMCKTDSENPEKAEGQCCPVCDEPAIIRPPAKCPSFEHCFLRCADSLRHDNIECYVCECLPDKISNPKFRELREAMCPWISKRRLYSLQVLQVTASAPMPQALSLRLQDEFDWMLVVQVSRLEKLKSLLSLKTIAASSKLDKKASLREKEDNGGMMAVDTASARISKSSAYLLRALWNHRPAPMRVGFRNDCCPSCIDQKKKTKSSYSLAAQKHEHTVCQSPGTGRLFTDGER